jgi:YgiT-type zinc finger domain-containing protein
MSRSINDALWQQLTQDMTVEMRAWRLAHPKATLRELELELDARLHWMRARMLDDLALTSSAADWTAIPTEELPPCPACSQALQATGTKPRTLHTHGGQALTLDRTYGVCPACGSGLFPPR